ncbi:MAG TPA: hypothetical protein VFG59_05005 [Anaeromyxobacter sp.]|nr:hypothetical protein [Anaeromyxobacter sp.]
MIVLAGTEEVRVLRSAREAEQELEGGFRPAVVLLASEPGGPTPDEFARRLEADPRRAGIPVMAVSEEADRVRLTLAGDRPDAHHEPEALCALLRVLEELCGDAEFLPG